MTWRYDPEVVESRWRLALAAFRFAWQRKARLYKTGAWCAFMHDDWTHCPVCRATVLALRLIEEAGR